jgi:hypothetical protein
LRAARPGVMARRLMNIPDVFGRTACSLLASL